MPLLSPSVGERVAGLQVLPGTLSRPSLACQLDEDTGFDWLTGGTVRYVSDGVETTRFTADGISLPLFSPGSVLFTGASGRLSEDTGLTYIAGTDLLTVVGGVITAAVGPTATQQHILPAVTSDTIALLTASQILTNKTFNLTSNTLVATSAQLITAVTDETGTGALVFATSPTLVTPLLGTPTSGTLTNCTGLPAASIVAGTFGAGNFTFPADLTIADQLIVSGVGSHVIGGAVDTAYQLSLTGTFSPAASGGAAIGFGTTVNAVGNTALMEFFGTLVEAGAGNHGRLAGMRFGFSVTPGAATVTDVIGLSFGSLTAATGTTNASIIKIDAAPTGATNNYALWVGGGQVRLDSSTQTTVGAAGAASALPANPTGYLRLWLGATEQVIPFYAQA